MLGGILSWVWTVLVPYGAALLGSLVFIDFVVMRVLKRERNETRTPAQAQTGPPYPPPVADYQTTLTLLVERIRVVEDRVDTITVRLGDSLHEIAQRVGRLEKRITRDEDD